MFQILVFISSVTLTVSSFFQYIQTQLHLLLLGLGHFSWVLSFRELAYTEQWIFAQELSRRSEKDEASSG